VDVSDFSGREPRDDFDVILEELGQFSAELTKKPMIVVASRIDVCQDRSPIEAVRAKAAEHGLPFQEISSVTGAGIEELRYAISSQLFSNAEHDKISVGS